MILFFHILVPEIPKSRRNQPQNIPCIFFFFYSRRVRQPYEAVRGEPLLPPRLFIDSIVWITRDREAHVTRAHGRGRRRTSYLCLRERKTHFFPHWGASSAARRIRGCLAQWRRRRYTGSIDGITFSWFFKRRAWGWSELQKLPTFGFKRKHGRLDLGFLLTMHFF